MKIISDKLKSW